MLKANHNIIDQFSPSFFAGSINDIIDVGSKVCVAGLDYSEKSKLRAQGKYTVDTSRLDCDLLDNDTLNAYKLNDRLIKCWTEKIGAYKEDVVNSVSQVFKQDNSHWLSTLEFIRQYKSNKSKNWKIGDGAWPTVALPIIKVFGRSSNGVYHHCLARFHLDIN